MDNETNAGNNSENNAFQHDLQVSVSRLREGLAEVDHRTRTIVRDHPVASVLGAAALGYLMGRIFSGKW